MWNLRKKNQLIHKTETHSQRKQSYDNQRGKGGSRGLPETCLVRIPFAFWEQLKSSDCSKEIAYSSGSLCFLSMN